MALSTSPYSTLTIRTGRALAVIPRSNSQTSPRRGGILFGIQQREQRAACLADFLVCYRAGIKRQCPGAAQDFNREGLLVSGRQGLEGLKEFDRMLAHANRLARLEAASNAAPCASSRDRWVPRWTTAGGFHCGSEAVPNPEEELFRLESKLAEFVHYYLDKSGAGERRRFTGFALGLNFFWWWPCSRRPSLDGMA